MTTNAKKLLAVIKSRNIWETEAINILFDKPEYSRESAFEVWQFEANTYGYAVNRPVNGVNTDFAMNVERSFADQTMDAVKELKAIGLLQSINCGYNNYSYRYVGK
jgi:hypothetical protein